MLRFLSLTLLLLSAAPSRADPEPTGLWLTRDRDGVIAISPCAGGLCARIAGVFLDNPGDKMPLDYRGVSQCGLKLITDARQIQPNLWKGHILDPRNGNIYGVELHLDPGGNLALRGFLGIPLLGQTQTWTRFTGKLPADCRIAPVNPGSHLAGQSRKGTMTERR
jgi:uncharacterized protein (DUF2147 family)